MGPEHGVKSQHGRAAAAGSAFRITNNTGNFVWRCCFSWQRQTLGTFFTMLVGPGPGTPSKRLMKKQISRRRHGQQCRRHRMREMSTGLNEACGKPIVEMSAVFIDLRVLLVRSMSVAWGKWLAQGCAASAILFAILRERITARLRDCRLRPKPARLRLRRQRRTPRCPQRMPVGLASTQPLLRGVACERRFSERRSGGVRPSQGPQSIATSGGSGRGGPRQHPRVLAWLCMCMRVRICAREGTRA